MACAEKGIGAASIGDGTLTADDRREIHDALGRKDKAAVSGCGMLPGWTELLAAHFLPAGNAAGEAGNGTATGRYLYCSLDRFGGYAFFRRVAKDAAREKKSPPHAPAGSYFAMDADLLGLPAGRPGSLYRRIGGALGAFGTAGREFSAALLYWLRGALGAEGESAAAVAGVWREGGGSPDAVSLEDPRGALAAALLAEVACRIAAGHVAGKGLLPLPEVIGREEAETIVEKYGGRISPA
jgi:hypothetical protein